MQDKKTNNTGNLHQPPNEVILSKRKTGYQSLRQKKMKFI